MIDLEDELDISRVVSEDLIKSKIYFIRGQKVMLDYDLASIYGYNTKSFNQQIKRNINRFDNDFMFRLTKEEVDYIARSQFVTSLNWATKHGGRTYLPYAFTEQGAYMLMTVLKGELAARQSKALIRTFKKMKDYLIEQNGIVSLNEVLKLSNYVTNNTKDIIMIKSDNNKIKKDIKNIKNSLTIVMDNFIDSNTYKHFLILNGEKVEADVAFQTIYKLAKKSIFIIDNYIDVKTLELLKVCNNNLKIIIFSDNKGKNNLTENYIKDFVNDTAINLDFRRTNNKYHDRYIIIDYNTENEMIYHCGASSKDAGKYITSIIKIEDTLLYHGLVEDLLRLL